MPSDLTPAEIAELPRLLAENERLRAKLAVAQAEIVRRNEHGIWLASDCEAFQWLVEDGWIPPKLIGRTMYDSPALKRQRLKDRAEKAEAELAEAVRIIVEMIETEEHPPLIKHEFTRWANARCDGRAFVARNTPATAPGKGE